MLIVVRAERDWHTLGGVADRVAVAGVPSALHHFGAENRLYAEPSARPA